MSNDTMLYKCPGPYDIHGGKYNYIIVDKDNEAAYEAALAEGWFETTGEAKLGFKAGQQALGAGKSGAEAQAASTAAQPQASVKTKAAPKAAQHQAW